MPIRSFQSVQEYGRCCDHLVVLFGGRLTFRFDDVNIFYDCELVLDFVEFLELAAEPTNAIRELGASRKEVDVLVYVLSYDRDLRLEHATLVL